MAVITMKQLLEAGVHFGHQTRKWNPEDEKVHLRGRGTTFTSSILQITVGLVEEAYNFIVDTVQSGQEHPVRRHEKTGAGSHQGRSGTLRTVLYQFPLAGRYAHQLQNHSFPHRPPQQTQKMEESRRVRSSSQKGSFRPEKGDVTKLEDEPRRHQRDAYTSRRDVRRRSSQ